MMKLPGNESRKCNLRDVLYVPNLSYNLVGVSKAVKAGKIVEFNGKNLARSKVWKENSLP